MWALSSPSSELGRRVSGRSSGKSGAVAAPEGSAELISEMFRDCTGEDWLLQLGAAGWVEGIVCP